MAIIIKKRQQAAPVPEPDALVKKTVKNTASQPVLDGQCLAAIGNRKNAAVSWFMMASYVYYVHDLSMISDELYDQLAKQILRDWDEIEHQHKRFLTKEDLAAGTLYTLNAKDYPRIVKGAAQHMIKGAWKLHLDVDWS